MMLERLAEQLPSELVWKILYFAACNFVYVDREWVVQLALVSRFVYRLVHDELYHNLVVTETNSHKLALLARDDSCSHIFLAARRLLSNDMFEFWDDERIQRLLYGLTTVDAPAKVIEKLSLSPEFCPCALSVRYSWLPLLPRSVNTATLASVTHLVGSFPSVDEYGPDMTLTPARIELILAAMPALTHLGFDVSSVSEFSDDEDEDDDLFWVNDTNQLDPDDSSSDELDLGALQSAMRAALIHPRMQVVALRVAGDWLRHWPAVCLMAVKLQDARVSVWHDVRPMRSWRAKTICAAADGWQGRDIWTEARQVWSPAK